MKKIYFLTVVVLLVMACNSGQSNKAKTDTTPALSQTNNDYPAPVDTLGFNSDSISNPYEKGSSLTTQANCLGCHKVKEASNGPSYVAIAGKYPATPENKKQLVSAIIKGSKGVWGQVPMEPNPLITEADATEMVNYILSMKGVK